VAVGNVVIADAPLTASLIQPPVNQTESIPFTAAVGTFVDANPGGTVSDFAASIDWGDGTPNSQGVISQPGGPGTAFVVSGSHTYGQAGAFGSITHDPIFVFVHDVGGSALTIANTANLAFVPFPKVTDVTFNRVDGQIQVTFQEFSAPSTGLVPLNQATLHDANNYFFSKFHQHGPYRYRISAINVGPPAANGSQVVTLTINKGQYLRGGHYFLDIKSVSPTNHTGIQDIYGNALDGEYYSFFPSGNNVPGGDFIAELDAVHHTIFAPATVVGIASPVVPPGTSPSKTTIPTVNPSQIHASTIHHAKAFARHKNVVAPKVVVHRNIVVAKTTAKPAKAESRVVDHALHQLTAEKHNHHRS
jgi:hypothetical protein